MRRRVVLTVAIAAGSALIVGLGAALAIVGTQLDEERIERSNLSFDAEDLRQELNAISEERDELADTLEEQRRTIEQLNAELERLRSASAPAAPSGTAKPAE